MRYSLRKQMDGAALKEILSLLRPYLKRHILWKHLKILVTFKIAGIMGPI